LFLVSPKHFSNVCKPYAPNFIVHNDIDYCNNFSKQIITGIKSNQTNQDEIFGKLYRKSFVRSQELIVSARLLGAVVGQDH